MHLTPQGWKYYSYVEGKNANPEGVKLGRQQSIGKFDFRLIRLFLQLPNTIFN
jgi:hypothetical protein